MTTTYRAWSDMIEWATDPDGNVRRLIERERAESESVKIVISTGGDTQ